VGLAREKLRVVAADGGDFFVPACH
jgi:hypothetical protein